jgi:uncharacterized OB-fold protein
MSFSKSSSVYLTREPFAAEVFTWPDEEPKLIGGRCDRCAAITFPRQPSCARCGTPGMARHVLPRRGTLWTYTTQEFLPKEPYASGETLETFQPYAVGLVELGDEVRVEGRLTVTDFAEIRIGMELEVTVVPFADDKLLYAFAPVGGLT